MNRTLITALCFLSLPTFLPADDKPAAEWATVQAATEIAAAEAPKIQKGDFSIAAWIKAADGTGGDILSQYDREKRRGFHLTLKSNPGVVSNQANWRHLQFGVDDNRDGEWKDHGRPGNALFAFSMATHDGHLYAGTTEPNPGDQGRVYRFDEEKGWIRCGELDGSNSVTALAVCEGALYAGTGKYRVAGSALPESENTTLGGRIFRLEGEDRWVDCGQLPEVEAVGGLVVHEEKLYASSLYQPAGFFRYEGGTQWTSLPVPSIKDEATGEVSPKRVVPLTTYQGKIYAGSYDGGQVYRFDGEDWTNCGVVGDNTQTYSFASHEGALTVGTWPSGRVYRFDGPNQWTDLGRLGEEREVMGMLVHNGRFLGGTLPLAEIYQYQGGSDWKKLIRLDMTPDVRYRRAWTMAEHDGRVFCSTLPSGHIHSFAAGTMAQWGHSLDENWHHVVAIKSNQKVTLYLDGNEVAHSDAEMADYDLGSDAPLRLGDGVNGPFAGAIQKLRIYHRALALADIATLAAERPE